MPVTEERIDRGSSYLAYLPAIYEDGDLGRFLLAFEHVLTGLGNPDEPGLEELVEGIPGANGSGPQLAGAERYFNPGRRDEAGTMRTPAEFLDWLASWLALSLRADWEEEEKRRLIAGIVPLYRKRGTREGLTRMLYTYLGLPYTETGGSIDVYELTRPLQVGRTSTVGVNTAVGGGPAHYFLVRMILPTWDPVSRARKEQIATAIIEQEKPAHTYYDLRVRVPTMQIRVHSTLGVDTLLGRPEA